MPVGMPVPLGMVGSACACARCFRAGKQRACSAPPNITSMVVGRSRCFATVTFPWLLPRGSLFQRHLEHPWAGEYLATVISFLSQLFQGPARLTCHLQLCTSFISSAAKWSPGLSPGVQGLKWLNPASWRCPDPCRFGNSHGSFPGASSHPHLHIHIAA